MVKALQKQIQCWLGSREPDAEDQFSDLVEAINERESSLREMSSPELQALAERLRQRVREGEDLERLLVDAFALVRESAWRLLDMRPYNVQILCGIALHRGKVAEMQTGEGKTLAAVAPIFLNSLSGRGVHVLTHNDYLARRDAGWMGPIFDFLGVSVGCVQEGMSLDQRRDAYRRDVTYLTAKEAGFDLLRDQLCLDPAGQVHKPFHYAVVDEADSILIDEARIPMVIAGSAELPDDRLQKLAWVARQLAPQVDYDTDAYARNIFLTEQGSRHAEALLDCGHLYATENTALMAELRNALHAHALLRRDVDYIVRDGDIELVDELTGRVAENRHWPDGLHSAVEAKEGLLLRGEGAILGSITLQHFLELYPRLCGMTGTAVSAARELREMYDLGVVEVPTHRPCIRADCLDRLFATRAAKHRALISEIAAAHAAGRPVLVGTVSVRESEQLATHLHQTGIPYQILNAKNSEHEAAIIAEAGALGAVTISTNMAGRGTDICLGGTDESDRQQVIDLGGLYVIGTNRHESRRIDDQLRGRAGRQGDPGTSRFFVSLEDDLMVRYRLKNLIPQNVLAVCAEGEIDHPIVRREIARAQRIVEAEGFDIRKRLCDYAEIVEKQRCLIGEWRQTILDGSKKLELLSENGGEESIRRCDALRYTLGSEKLEQIERHLSLVILDRCWSDHLAALQRVRDEIHLVQLNGRTPLVEFCRLAGEAFEELLQDIDQEIVDTFLRLEIAADGTVDWHAEGLQGPSATWTYLVSDNVFGNNALLPLANHASFAFLGVLLLGPVLFVWGLYQHWLKRRRGFLG